MAASPVAPWPDWQGCKPSPPELTFMALTNVHVKPPAKTFTGGTMNISEDFRSKALALPSLSKAGQIGGRTQCRRGGEPAGQ